MTSFNWLMLSTLSKCGFILLPVNEQCTKVHRITMGICFCVESCLLWFRILEDNGHGSVSQGDIFWHNLQQCDLQKFGLIQHGVLRCLQCNTCDQLYLQLLYCSFIVLPSRNWVARPIRAYYAKHLNQGISHNRHSSLYHDTGKNNSIIARKNVCGK